MSVVSNNILAGAAGQGGADESERSIRLNSADSAFLSRTPSSASNRKTWTFSCWFKRGKIDENYRTIFGAGGGTDRDRIQIHNDEEITVSFDDGSDGTIKTTQVFRDTAWYHLVVALDTTQATDSNRVKIYVNGSQVTSLATTSYPSQNYDGKINNNIAQFIGNSSANDLYFDGYMAEINFVDGTALSSSSFGEFDSNGNWVAKDTADLTFGTNGFRLQFADNSAATATTLGEDTSGNSNNWTPNNLSVAAGVGNDSLTDSPSNNFATLNPLHAGHSTLTNGNLDASGSSDLPTIIPGSGQWYYEIGTTGYNWDGTAANFTSAAGSYNFGQRPFSGTPNSGHKAVCTNNLPDPTIAEGSKQFAAKTYDGNGGTQSISGLEFSPSWTWLKNRAEADNHKLVDIVRGVTKELESNSTDAEDTNADGLTAFTSDGFSLGADVEYNTNSEAYISWNWNAGTSTVTNNNGSIASQVRANTNAGISIVTWTGQSSGTATIGTGLNAAAELIILKGRTGSVGWTVGHQSLGWTKALQLDGQDAAATSANYWNDTAPTSTVFTSGANNVNNTFLAYCISSIPGYSTVGSYVGNGSGDGVFVNTNFRPAFILLRASSISGEDWVILDTARATFNVSNFLIKANTNQQEFTNSAYNTDILSNGFKLRNSNARFNSNGVTYVYYAVAEHPFKTARAR
tara:strand:+ start:7019 stop:9076 length:2058 start_codon:yes stop_codon:yes gene_type:complete